SALWIGDQLVVNNDGPHGMTERSGQIALQAGTHAIRVTFYEGGGDCGLIARVEGGGLSRQVIPPSMWRYVPNAGDLNCDGVVNAADVPAFVLAVLDPAAYAAQYPGCSVARGDMNGSGTVDGNDIQLFFD